MNALRGLLAAFASPYALLAGAGAALVFAVLLFWAARRRAARAAALVSPELAAKARLAPPASTPAAAAVLAVLVALSLGAAFARPHWGDTQERAERRGADVVLVLDTSASMRAADVSPSRFALARQAAQSLVARLGSDRVALVSCEGDAQALVPLTLDAAAVGLFLDAIEPGMGAKPGTSIAAGIAAAAELFPPGVGGGRHLVFFSDGEDLEGGVDAAIGRAKAEGITIHAVFVGAASGTGAPVPEVDAAGRTSGYKSDVERPARPLEARPGAPPPARGRDGRVVHGRLVAPDRPRGRGPPDRPRRAPSDVRGPPHDARGALPDPARRRGGGARVSCCSESEPGAREDFLER